MNQNVEKGIVKVAIIIALAVIASVFLYRYMSPYNSCVRGLTASDPERNTKYIIQYCAEKIKAN